MIGLAKLKQILHAKREFCHRCGRQQESIWHVPDWLWAAVVGRKYGIVCMRCFDQMADHRAILIRWTGVASMIATQDKERSE